MKRSLKSYFIATLFSVTTATVYFAFTPLDEVQSELLARTSPTIYDVFIALVGGLAGIVALATKEKGNVIPGVAIATALMPPLCTAGFGLATGNLLYFLGAFYLYFINSVFISLATFIGVRVMHFQRKQFVDKAREKLVRRYIVWITIGTMCPAVYLTYGIVKETFYQSEANSFVTHELQFADSQILSREISYKKREIRVVLLGKEVSEEQIETARQRMAEHYQLPKTELVVFQGGNNQAVPQLNVSELKSSVMEDFYRTSKQQLAEQQSVVDSLQRELQFFSGTSLMDSKMNEEVKVLFPNVRAISISRSLRLEVDSNRIDTLTFAIVACRKVPSKTEEEKMRQWLQARVSSHQLKLILE